MRRLAFWQLPIKKKSWVQLNYVTQEACDFTLARTKHDESQHEGITIIDIARWLIDSQ